jgi:lantibiotic modifying enzyme
MTQWLEHEATLEALRQLINTITPEIVETDRRLDFFWGSAGLLHGLMAVQEAGIDDTLSAASIVGNHLLSKRVTDRNCGYSAWRTLGAEPWSGFAHGSSGIASSLLRLNAYAPDPRYVDAARQAFAFERSIYRPQTRDWPDHRDDVPRYRSWCHGAPGVALARLSAIPLLEIGDMCETIDDLDVSLSRTSAESADGPCNLCCGSFGRAQILFEAGRRLENESLLIQARFVASQAMALADVRGYQENSSGDAHVGRGFWQGLAGVGYTMLMLAGPLEWPCVLSLS